MSTHDRDTVRCHARSPTSVYDNYREAWHYGTYKIPLVEGPTSRRDDAGMRNIGDVLAAIMGRFPGVILGETVLKHLDETKGTGRYQEVPRADGAPWQFVYFDQHENDTGKFVGLATHMSSPQEISFGAKHDNR
jgi:hypothetical protein